MLKRLVVQVVSEDAQGEDGDGQQVASGLGSSGDFGEEVGAVLGSCDNVPEDGVERDGSEDDWVSGGEVVSSMAYIRTMVESCDSGLSHVTVV